MGTSRWVIARKLTHGRSLFIFRLTSIYIETVGLFQLLFSFFIFIWLDVIGHLHCRISFH